MRQTFIITFKDGLPEQSCWEAWALLREYLRSKGVYEQLKDVLPKMSRVWTEVVIGAEGPRCTGFATLAYVWDVSNFHCEDERSRARLIQRISTVIEESQGGRTAALVRVNPEAEAEWTDLLAAMGAQPANRWLVPAGAAMEKRGEKNVLRTEQAAIQSE